MLENGAFDHMLGFMQSPDYPIAGLSGQESLPRDPADPAGGRVGVSPTAEYRGTFNLVPDDDSTSIQPGHDAADVHEQLYRGSPATSDASGPDGEPTNQGFVWDYAQQPRSTLEHAEHIMFCFAPDRLPVMTTLARQFALCDHWFSSMPGPTWPNRLFVHAATSAGHVDGALVHEGAYAIDTIYDRLDAAHLTWRIYFHDIPQSATLDHLQADSAKGKFRLFGEFLADARSGALPKYSFIEPRYLDLLYLKANDQHPPHDVALGEHLVADVYEALRGGPLWEKTLLVVTYDEHGGLYDHVPPPPAVNPDGLVSAAPAFPFAFNRLGVRVPAVLVSPYIPASTIDSTVYDHTSLLATVERRFGLPPLTRRDAAAHTFEANLSLAAPRTDTPATLPRPDDPISAEAHKQSQAGLVGQAYQTLLSALRGGARGATAPISGLQHDLLGLVRVKGGAEGADGAEAAGAAEPTTEHEAALLVNQFTHGFFGHLFP
jgi:phospholipase C